MVWLEDQLAKSFRRHDEYKKRFPQRDLDDPKARLEMLEMTVVEMAEAIKTMEMRLTVWIFALMAIVLWRH